MKNFYYFLIISFFALTILTIAQSFDGDWSVEYVTPDNEFVPNSIGQRTISVTVLNENEFVALAANYGVDSYYLVGYKNASHETGILGEYPYGAESKKTKWVDGFFNSFLEAPKDIASHGNIIYVANNDADHSILAFELREDSIYTYPQRYKTGNRDLGAIDIDAAGHIFITILGDSSTPGSLLVLDDPVSSGWNSSASRGTILHEIVLPAAGTAHGVTVNEDGTIVYVSNYLT